MIKMKLKNLLTDSRIRITSNPMNLNYSDPDDTLVEVTCFDNPNHIRLPATNNNNSIDTSTYNKKDKNKNWYVVSYKLF